MRVFITEICKICADLLYILTWTGSDTRSIFSIVLISAVFCHCQYMMHAQSSALISFGTSPPFTCRSSYLINVMSTSSGGMPVCVNRALSWCMCHETILVPARRSMHLLINEISHKYQFNLAIIDLQDPDVNTKIFKAYKQWSNSFYQYDLTCNPP